MRERPASVNSYPAPNAELHQRDKEMATYESARAGCDVRCG
jgi:hypothetical protein